VSATYEALAAHRAAREHLLDTPHHSAPHHYGHYDNYVDEHHAYRTVEHEYAVPAEHTVYYDAPVHGVDHHVPYDQKMTYDHDHDDEFHEEYDQTCGKKTYCHRFAQELAHDRGYGLHRDSEEWYNGVPHQNSLMAAYYVVPDSLVIHEDAINC